MTSSCGVVNGVMRRQSKGCCAALHVMEHQIERSNGWCSWGQQWKSLMITMATKDDKEESASEW